MPTATWSPGAKPVTAAPMAVTVLPVTRPSRIAADLLADRADLGAVAQLIADALRLTLDDPGSIALAMAPHAAAHGLRRGDGIGLLRWLLDLSGDPDAGNGLRACQQFTSTMHWPRSEHSWTRF